MQCNKTLLTNKDLRCFSFFSPFFFLIAMAILLFAGNLSKKSNDIAHNT